MKNKKNLDLQYLDIKSQKDLKEVIFFLENGFKWSKDKSSLLYNKLPKINKQLNVHGIMIKAETDIVGAMLFFHQGFLNIANDKRPVVNMSSWYIHKEFRGLPTITFLRYMLDNFDNYIFTNYSANSAAEKILIAVGFKKMQLRRATSLISDCILNYSKIKIKDINKDSLNIEKHIETYLDDGTDIRFLELEIERNRIQLIVKKRILKRSLLGMKFNWRITSIIWTSDETIVSKYWKKICNKLLLHTKSMKLTCDFSINFPIKAKEQDNNYLYFLNDGSLDYISPIQSEMNIFD